MRTLNPYLQTEVSRAATAPFYLVELVFQSTTLRLSTGRDVSWRGYDWLATGVAVTELTPLEGGMEGRLSLPNADLGASALVLAEDIHDRPCRIWILYGDGPYGADDAVLLFDGAVDGMEIPPGSLRVELALQSRDAGTAFAPRIFCAPPLCHHAPPVGTVIDWDGERHVMERGWDRGYRSGADAGTGSGTISARIR